MKKKELNLNNLENETLQIVNPKTTKKRRKYKHSIKSKKIRLLIKQIQISNKKHKRVGVGKVNTLQVKKYIKKYGTKATITHLQERLRYSYGFANEYAIQAIYERIKRGYFDNELNPVERKQLKELLKNIKKGNLYESDLQDILEILYNRDLSLNQRLNFAYQRSLKFGA